ncbi:MAG: HAMP domain-containing sensor histidine kinase [Bacteroidota bacterium]|nr:HAMP domain-containing sensor histidine kinase [Bacteroidota bacterium]
MFRKTLVLAFLSIVFFSIAYLNFSGFYPQKVNFEDSETAKTNELIKKSIKECDIVLGKISDLLCNEKPTFSILNSISSIPFTVYKNQEIIYWPYSRYIPPYNSIKQDYKYKIIRSPEGRFLTVKYSFLNNNDKYDVAFLICITNNFEVENKYLKSGPNPAFFNPACRAVNLYPGQYNIYTPDNYFLFSLEYFEDATFAQIKENIGWLFLIIGCILFIYFVFQLSDLKTPTSIFSIALSTIILIEILYFLIEKWASNQKSFSTEISDIKFLVHWLFIQLAAIAIIIFISTQRAFYHEIQSYFKKGIKYVHAIFPLLILTPLSTSIVFYHFLLTINNSEIANISIETFINFNYFKILSLFSIILFSVLFFILSAVSIRFWDFLESKNKQRLYVLLLVIIITSAVVLYLLFGIQFAIVSIATGVYLIIIKETRLNNTLNRIRYITYLYFFICIAFVSIAVTAALYESRVKKLNENSTLLAQKVISKWGKTDVDILFDISRKISVDKYFVYKLSGPFMEFEMVKTKIKKFYLRDFLADYETNVYIFDSKGQPLSDMARNYFAITNNLKAPAFKTNYRNIYRQIGQQSVFYINIEVVEKSQKLAYILIENKLKKKVANSVIPELFRESEEHTNTQYLNYATYENQRLLASSGAFNYNKYFNFIDSTVLNSLKTGIYKFNFWHKYYSYTGNKGVIVSCLLPSPLSLYANFSLIFVCFAFMLGFVIFANTFYVKINQASTSYTTKIQVFINAAFFIPLVIVSIVSFWVLSNVYTHEVEETFEKKSTEVALQVSNGYSKESSQLESVIKNLGISDVLFYNIQGILVNYNADENPSYHLFSSYLNPKAYEQLFENKDISCILPERFGLFSYKTAYHTVFSPKDGQVVGVIALPFFDSYNEIENRIIWVFSIMLSIFTTVFVLFLILSFFASQALTKPLMLLTKKIKTLTLGNHNEPLNYKAKDEIGLLVNEYNKMIIKLEESRKFLADREKETAWKDMARQLAHEIKNPLTPMKLILQNMQNKLRRGESIELDQQVSSMLTHIDTLSDIATSFSTFTQMPDIEVKATNISSVIRNCAALFENEHNMQIDTKNITPNIMGYADEKLLSRIGINLLINAFESIEYGKTPIIEINLYLDTSNQIICSITDNGGGIPAENHNQVFQPNFSTKTYGSGIGLAVAKKGIEQMGGKIWFETQLGIGTTFYISLKSAPS